MKHDATNRYNKDIKFEEGDHVWLSTEHLKLHNQPSKKVQQRHTGPYPIVSKISDASFELDLPKTMQCHNVFHISKLRPYTSDNVQPDYIPVAIERERQDFIVDHNIIEHTSHRLEMVFMNEDHAWCLKSDGLVMIVLPTHGKHINHFVEFKLLTSTHEIMLASRNYIRLRDMPIYTKNIHSDSRFLTLRNF